MRMWKLAVAGATAGVLVLGGGVAYASANTPGNTPGGTPTATPATGQASAHARNGTRRGHRPLPRRMVHGTFTIRIPRGYKTVAVQRGMVTAVSGDTVTVTSPDKQVRRYTMNGDTRVRLDRRRSDRGHVAKGLHARVITSPKSGTSVARLIALRHPKAH